MDTLNKLINLYRYTKQTCLYHPKTNITITHHVYTTVMLHRVVYKRLCFISRNDVYMCNSSYLR